MSAKSISKTKSKSKLNEDPSDDDSSGDEDRDGHMKKMTSSIRKEERAKEKIRKSEAVRKEMDYNKKNTQCAFINGKTHERCIDDRGGAQYGNYCKKHCYYVKKKNSTYKKIVEKFDELSPPPSPMRLDVRPKTVKISVDKSTLVSEDKVSEDKVSDDVQDPLKDPEIAALVSRLKTVMGREVTDFSPTTSRKKERVISEDQVTEEMRAAFKKMEERNQALELKLLETEVKLKLSRKKGVTGYVEFEGLLDKLDEWSLMDTDKSVDYSDVDIDED